MHDVGEEYKKCIASAQLLEKLVDKEVVVVDSKVYLVDIGEEDRIILHPSTPGTGYTPNLQLLPQSVLQIDVKDEDIEEEEDEFGPGPEKKTKETRIYSPALLHLYENLTEIERDRDFCEELCKYMNTKNGPVKVKIAQSLGTLTSHLNVDDYLKAFVVVPLDDDETEAEDEEEPTSHTSTTTSTRINTALQLTASETFDEDTESAVSNTKPKFDKPNTTTPDTHTAKIPKEFQVLLEQLYSESEKAKHRLFVPHIIVYASKRSASEAMALQELFAPQLKKLNAQDYVHIVFTEDEVFGVFSWQQLDHIRKGESADNSENILRDLLVERAPTGDYEIGQADGEVDFVITSGNLKGLLEESEKQDQGANWQN
eukprot:TRINITY_DN105969_c0_g1_i1.p1 TRINITY_DN105969_c0_g1~~TRINITY_DN105969_c0_g1_i1.p1  ORF type:complete len:400 (-),score=60.14 TRINITY_DN105969_c0_g1_i1:101-1213(-)